jgi:hypothetical protein
MSIGLIVTRSVSILRSGWSGTFWRGDERVNLEQMALKVSHYRSCMAAHGIATVAEFER